MMHLKIMKLIMMKQQLETICIALTASAFMAANAFAAVAADRPENTGTTEMPQGLWQAFSRARLLIEPVKDPSSGARFAGQNPANRLYFLFDEKGVTFKRGSDWSLGMQLESYGTRSNQQTFPTQKLHLDGNTVTLDRGDIQEWYINRAQGLEQGFTLADKPAGHTAGEDIVLKIQLSGDLEPRWQREGEKIAFYTEQSDYAFSYDKLLVVDANGKNLPAKMLLAQGQLQIQFDPTGAQWPVTVDPVVSVETKLVGADNDAATNDNFGYSVALSADTALIGALNDDCSVTILNCGSAYVFGTTGGGWVFQGKLTASDAINADFFGYSVALSADTALIGAFRDDCSATILDCGSAYVFTRTGSSWSQQAKLTASDAATYDYFGKSVALSADTALIGAYRDDCSATILDCGSAYVFTRTGSSWSQQAKLTASDAGAVDYFGDSVALDADTALIGASSDDCVAGANCGSAYVFTRSASIWSQQQKLTAADGAPNDFFGNSVALSAETALIGAYQDDDGATNSGSAYVFTRSGSNWSQQQKLSASDAATYDYFGKSVALSGDTALIGAYSDDDGGTDSGSAYVFNRSGSTWSQQQKLTASDATSSDYFGFSVALSADTALIGAILDDDGGTNSGSAYAFSRSGSTWAEERKLTAVNARALHFFGNAVALSGDTALIAAYSDDVGGWDRGSAYVFTRSGSTWSQQQKLTASDAADYDLFGYSVALAGDTVLIGAYQDDDGGTDSGSAYVYTRSGSTWSLQQKLTASDAAAYTYFGYSVALAGDTALIGSYEDDCSTTVVGCGSAYVYIRSGSTWSQQQKLTASDAAASDAFGYSVALSADTALIGAYQDDDGGTNSGSAYVFTRSGSTWSQQKKLTASDAAAGDQFGNSVALSVDAALIGAENTGIYRGSAYVFARTGSTWSQQQKLTATDGADYDYFGYSVALSANTVLIGAYTSNAGGYHSGSAYLYTWTGSAWSQQRKLLASVYWSDALFGSSVALSGDTALIGAMNTPCSNLGNYCGAAYLLHFACGYGKGLLANRWTMIGIPCDPGAANTVQDIFGDQLNPSRYYSRWILYKRDATTDAYSLLSLASPMALGEGYWIISLDATVWDVSGTETARDTSNANCITVDGCYVINLTPPGVGQPPRFNLIGHVFSFDVDWTDVRVEVNGTAYTPSGAKAAGYMEKSMWIYNGNGYDVFDDTTPGMEGTLMAQDGIWVEVFNGAAGKSIKLLVPVRNTFGSPPGPPPPTVP